MKATLSLFVGLVVMLAWCIPAAWIVTVLDVRSLAVFAGFPGGPLAIKAAFYTHDKLKGW